MKSPTVRLVAGLAFTLLVISGYALYTLHLVSRMREIQTSTIDRNRLASLQLIRIQNDLNALGLAMRDMLDSSGGYPVAAWEAPLARMRQNLDDAMAKEAELARGNRSPQQTAFLAASFADFWSQTAQVLGLARAGEERRALEIVRNTLQPKQEALSALTARLLVDNNDQELRTGEQVRAIYSQIERNAYLFLGLSLALILITSAGLIRSNRTLFARLSELAEQRRELARQLISTQESTFRAISRDLHDEFGQILTALGAMLRRAAAHAPDSTFRDQTHEASVMVQGTLEKIRSLSQSLQPVILEEQGLVAAIEWHLAGFERHTGIAVVYQRPTVSFEMPAERAIHVYRILQEALNNVARHADVAEVQVTVDTKIPEGDGTGTLELIVEDRGRGVARDFRPGVGLAAMRERAELIGGTLTITPAESGAAVVGTCVRLQLPAGAVTQSAAQEAVDG